MKRSTARVSRFIENSDRPTSGLWEKLGETTYGRERKLFHASSSRGTPPLAYTQALITPMELPMNASGSIPCS